MGPRVFGAVALASACVCVVPAAAEQSQQNRRAQQQQEEVRFRGMDRNNDGRVTWQEWRGNAQSFRLHDWNRDGVLSGDELRPGAQRRGTIDEQGAEFDDWTPEAFADLDHNRDGRLTREEWHYDRQAWLRADSNRDNVITRAEFLRESAPDLDRSARFERLDTNNNGRLERAEWTGSRDAFTWLDRNDDGVLTRTEVVGDTPGNEPVGTSGRALRRGDAQVIVVDAAERWVDTGIDLHAGESVTIHTEGMVRLSENGNDTSSAAGATRRAVNAPLPNHPAGALIARVGNGAPIFLGDNTATRNVTSGGRLYLGVNDDHLGDNSGHFRVTVTVRR